MNQHKSIPIIICVMSTARVTRGYARTCMWNWNLRMQKTIQRRSQTWILDLFMSAARVTRGYARNCMRNVGSRPQPPGNNFGRSWQLGNNRQNPSRPKTKFASGRKMCRINCVQQRSSSQPTIPHGVWRSRCHRLVPVTQYNTARTTRDEIRWGEMLIEDNPDNSWNNSDQEMSSYDNSDNS